MMRIRDHSFISPYGKNQKEITQALTEAIKILISHFSKSAGRSTLPDKVDQVHPDYHLDESHSYKEVFDQVKLVLVNSMNHFTPNYIGQMDSMPNIGSVIGEIFSTAINNNMLATEMSPLLTRMEYSLVKWFCQSFGMDEGSGGVMTSGGTLANLQALCVARNKLVETRSGNIQKLNQELVLFTSELGHTSIDKAAMILGIGSENVIKIPCDKKGRMVPSLLRNAIQEQRSLGKLPTAVISTYGTTNLGSADPINEIQQVCNEFKVWHHIDAIYGGALVFVGLENRFLKSFAKADSLSFNPQKWLFVAKTCSLLMFKDAKLLERHFRINAPYMSTSDEIINLGEIGIQGSRHAEILKLYLSLYLIGKQGYKAIIKNNIELTSFAMLLIKDTKNLEFLTSPEMNIILFRTTISRRSLGEMNSVNNQLQQRLLLDHNLYLGLVSIKGENWLKMVILNPYATKRTIQKVFDRVASILK